MQNPVPPQTAGDCLAELSKYDWPYVNAKAIMMKESRNNPLTVNDNPATGDYSVGCFQVNIIGSLASSRPSEDWLKNPENNVAYAYQMYVNQGRTFCKTSGWHNSCVATGVEGY